MTTPAVPAPPAGRLRKKTVPGAENLRSFERSGRQRLRFGALR